MNYLERKGKRRTINISISMLLLTIYSIYINQSSRPEIDTTKLVTQIIRTFLTGGILLFVYEGKDWARIITIILSAIAVIMALGVIFTTEHPTIMEVPFFVMIIIYSDAIYHFGFSESYKAFSEFQRKKYNNA